MSGHTNIHDDDDDLRGAAETASRHAGDSGSSDLFGSILDAIVQKKPEIEQGKGDLDETAAIKKHKKYFEDDDDDDDDDDDQPRSMGTAAAMQALKMFTGHAPPGAPGAGAAGEVSGQKQSEFIGLALSEASKLFDKKSAQGKVSASSTKESAVMQAGEMALKMYMKSKSDAPATGPGSASGLVSLAGKYLK